MQYRASIHHLALTEHVVANRDRAREHPSDRDDGRIKVAEIISVAVVNI